MGAGLGAGGGTGAGAGRGRGAGGVATGGSGTGAVTAAVTAGAGAGIGTVVGMAVRMENVGAGAIVERKVTAEGLLMVTYVYFVYKAGISVEPQYLATYEVVCCQNQSPGFRGFI